MQKFLSRKFLTLVGTWCYALGGLITGALDAKTALTALGASGTVYLVVEGVIDALRAFGAQRTAPVGTLEIIADSLKALTAGKKP